ncbi:MAG: TonB-dependent receptor plug domain-containing protein [Chitinophagaceae bacterium]|nr:TonB-dependent receptor plug domain-containing protein [Chitinophagaceae bacterium]
MRKHFFERIPVCLYILLWCSNTPLFGQDDSIKTVLLNDVMITAEQKQTSQQLVQFFRYNQGATLEDILSRLPEMSLIRRSSYGMEPTIRNYSAGQVNVMVGGMRLHGACTDKMDPATIYIEPINLENIQLQTGTQGSLKGSALGGTIDMKIAEPVYYDDNRVHGTIQTGYQSVSNGFYGAGILQGSHGRWAYRTSGTFRMSDNYTDGDGKEVAFSQFNKVNATLAARYRLTDYSFVQADVIADDGWDIGYPALPMDVGMAKARIASVSYQEHDPSKIRQHNEMKLYYNKVRHSMDDTKRPDVPIHMDMPGLSETAGFYATTDLKFSPGNSLLLRADASTTFLTASMTMYPEDEPPMYMLTWPDNRRNQGGISAQWQWQADTMKTLKVQARLDAVQSMLTTQEAKDHVSVTGGNTNNRFDLLKNLGVQYVRKFRNNRWLQASAGFAERMPTASELYGFYLYNAFDNYDYIGATDLKNEQSLQAEIGAGSTRKKFKWQAAVYYHYMFDYILGEVNPDYSAMTIGANGVKVYTNSGNAWKAGGEASLQWQMAPLFAVVSTVRYTYAQHDTGDALPFISPFKNITSFRYAAKRFSVQAEYEAAAAQNHISTIAGERITSGYFLTHFRTGYVFPWGKNLMNLQAGIENIFDATYREHLDWGNLYRPGRNIYLQIQVGF